MADETKVKILGREHVLKAPPSYAVRSEIVGAAVDNWRRAYVAALGICAPGLRLRTRYERCGYSPLVYGAAVLDELVAGGVGQEEIWHAAGVAFGVLARTIVTELEVADAEGFSAPGDASIGR